MTLGIMTFSITTPNIKGYITTLSKTPLYRYAECRVLFVVLLNVVMLGAVALNQKSWEATIAQG